MLENKDIECIICEHHDDLLVKWRNGQYYFIQVKTRTEGEGEWTLTKLLYKASETEKSILEKLFEKKLKFGMNKTHQYFFVSDMGASNGGKPIGLQTLKKLNSKEKNNWGKKDKADFSSIVNTIKEKIEHRRIGDLEDFCNSLKVETWQPGKQSIRAYNISMLQEALKKTFGFDLLYPDLERIYEEILRIVRDANIVENEYSPIEQTVEQKAIRREQMEALIEGSTGTRIYLERVEPIRPGDFADQKYPPGELHLDGYRERDYFLNFSFRLCSRQAFQLAGSRSVIC